MLQRVTRRPGRTGNEVFLGKVERRSMLQSTVACQGQPGEDGSWSFPGGWLLGAFQATLSQSFCHEHHEQKRALAQLLGVTPAEGCGSGYYRGDEDGIPTLKTKRRI
ncbi:hypothetical protein NDU88_002086 [Pleurodeles waltl]|uniref:Uncharacterized protein n=1 Tax=Pleurodeles waltl TaxID=8319 RepID=A0AAV7TKU1_PLEWA|nr:hypothetical protein NDU88_002086 [Pleurodeles waltl]